MRTVQTLIRLGGCPGWSESSLGAHSLCWFCHVAAHLHRSSVKLKRQNIIRDTWNEPTHEIMALFVLRKLILQTRMRCHPVWLDVWFLVGPFVYCANSEGSGETSRMRRLPEPSLFAYAITTIISWAGSYHQRYMKWLITKPNFSWLLFLFTRYFETW